MTAVGLYGIEQALCALAPGSRVLVQGCATESDLLAQAVMDLGERLPDLIFTGIFVPGLNRHTYLSHAGCRTETFFLTPQLKAVPHQTDFLPLCYDDIYRRFQTLPIAAALFMVSPPDQAGLCSFGPTQDFLAELWPLIPVRLAHVNPAMPRVEGRCIPFDALTATVEAEAQLKTLGEVGTDNLAGAVARHALAYIPEAATLQIGLGRIPGALLKALSGHRGLRVHSGLVGDGVLDLVRAGALADDGVVGGCAIGSPALYQAVTAPPFRFAPVSITHGRDALQGLDRFVAVNSALEVDLFGQAYSEFGPDGWMSGPGGALDYARAARANGGLRMIVLAASAARGTLSRIVGPGQGRGPFSLGRMDVDVVVTEHGAADLRGLTADARAAALIQVAAPQHRPGLREAWAGFSIDNTP